MVVQIKKPLLLGGCPLQIGSYKRTTMISGSWNLSQPLELSLIPTLVWPSTPMLRNSGVRLFYILIENFSNSLSSELAGGSKQVRWKDIENDNEWYISKTFLLHGKTFKNPTRLSEVVMRAYWKHWFQESQSGNQFTFRRVGAHDEKSRETTELFVPETPPVPEPSDPEEDELEEKKKGEPDVEEPDENEGKAKGKGRDEGEGEEGDEGEEEEEPPAANLTPNQCGTDEEKISFLQSLLVHNQKYQAIVNCLARMRVSRFHHVIFMCLLTKGI